MIPPKDIWQIAFDGSGPVTQQDVHYAYAGVVGSRPAWGAFAQRWEPILNEFDIPYLHMVEAMNFRGPFAAKSAEWGEQRIAKRDELLWRLIRLVRDLDLRTVGLAIQVGSADTDKGTALKKGVFQRVITQIINDHRERHYFLICDTEHDAADHYRRWLINLQVRDENSKRVACLCFADDKVLAPIQVADVAAYLLREDADRALFRPNDPQNPLVVALREGSPPVVEGIIPHGEPLG